MISIHIKEWKGIHSLLEFKFDQFYSQKAFVELC